MGVRVYNGEKIIKIENKEFPCGDCLVLAACSNTCSKFLDFLNDNYKAIADNMISNVFLALIRMNTKRIYYFKYNSYTSSLDIYFDTAFGMKRLNTYLMMLDSLPDSECMQAIIELVHPYKE